ncbi:MAG: hypothetical protein R3E01_13750 [Pirellulaceae bacterium]|nr:hypothetical protein [Planctomycetales bacterium]
MPSTANRIAALTTLVLSLPVALPLMRESSVLAVERAATQHAASASDPEQVARDTDAAVRPLHEVQRELRDVMRRELRADALEERADAVLTIVALHDEIVRHPSFASSDAWQRLRAKAGNRLRRIRDELRKDFKAPQVAAVDVPPQQQVLPQLLGNPPAQPGVDPLGINPNANNPAANVANRNGAGNAGPFGPARDLGPQLVALIERTISPAFWDVNGGPGAVVYYQPLQVLVIRATDDVHRQIGGTLGAVRQAGP